ncbi:Phosphatidylinositol N-acetyglucosaminlytransferase subunit P-related [Quillaja saponaria]|uniref:Phosphatidylinositol N-acetyglucosaminlytransferase subunit P-related n=1 Tax=Quillaja saponaria TaxID=32244 RepID=A0AAD7Q6P1_QUISA|nr:Phosphatidylinositol N-acetyglucosaminlytransferase subunit P-related [Quillaja saponaria]
MDSKHHTQSVIAKLMGLDDLPPRHPVRKKQRALSENYLQKIASIGVGVKYASHKHPSFRMNIGVKAEFENVFGVVETLDKDKHHILSAQNGEGNAGSLEECNSVTNMLETLIESQDSIEVLDCKEDLFLKHLQGPTTLFNKHLNQLQDTLHYSKSGNVDIFKSYVPKSGDVNICWNLGRTTKKGDVKLPGKINNGLQKTANGEIDEKIFRFSKSPLASKDEAFHSSRIVVLKSNPAKEDSAVRCFPLPSSCGGPYLADEVQQKKFSPANARIYSKVKGRKGPTYHMDSVKQCPRVLSEISEEVFSQTRNEAINLSKLVPSGIRGDDKSAGRYEMLKPSSKCFDSKNRFHSVFSSSKGSYLTGEAKKKISEGWTVAGIAKEVARGQDITLGELLTIADHETGPRNLDYKPGNHGLSNKSNSSDRKNNFGIRRQYGLKVERGIKSPIFRPLSAASSTSTGNTRTRSKDYIIHNFWSLRPKGSLNWVTHNNSTKATSEQALRMVNYVADDGKTQIVSSPPQKTPCIFLGRDFDSSRHASETSVQQETSVGFHEEGSVYSFCSMNLEEAYHLSPTYHPSPISVLDLQFREEVSSSSESLEVAGASCDSCTDTEEPGMNVSSDEDSGEGSRGDPEENEALLRLSTAEESRDFSYLVEILIESGFYSRNLHTDFNTWHSPECPINPSVFKILEKKFGEQTYWKRSDRRLLFDRINMGLMEILLPCMGIPMCEKPVSRRLNAKPSEEMMEEELWNLLVVQEKESIKDSAEKTFGRDLKWAELGDDIDAIVREIVKLLIDELATEIVSLESF